MRSKVGRVMLTTITILYHSSAENLHKLLWTMPLWMTKSD